MNSQEEAFMDFVNRNADVNFGVYDSDDDESASQNTLSASSRGSDEGCSSDESSFDWALRKGKQKCSQSLNRRMSLKVKSRYSKKELQLALMVIKKVMKMDEAQPFNAPFDPIAFGIPNYLDVIDTPMDFGTIWSNLRNGVKYMNSEDVYMDVKCIWENCWKYSKKGDYTFCLMKHVKSKFLKYWTEAGLYSERPQKNCNFSKRQSQYEPKHLPSSSYHLDHSKQPPHRNFWPQLSLLQPSIYRHPYQLEQPQPQSNYNPLQFSLLQTATYGSSAVMKSNKCVPSCLVSPMIDSANQPEPQQTHLREEQPNCMQQPEQSSSQQQPPQIQATRDIGQSHVSPAKSMRDGNFACKGVVVSMTNNPSQEHDVQSGPSHPQPKLPSAGLNQPSASQNEPYESQMPRQNQNVKRKTQVRKQNVKRKTLVPTRDNNLQDSLDGEPIFIPINKLGQAVGPKATVLSNFLGKVARDGHLAPLTYATWRKMPDEMKEEMWLLVRSKFDIDARSKRWVLKTIGRRWKDWKAKLKADHYYPHKTDEERLNDCHPRVLQDQWRILISYWNCDKVKLYCAKNKASAAKQKGFHTAGSKSFARIREEEKAKRPNRKEPSRAELYILTHTRKNGQPVDDAAAAIISKLREQATHRQQTVSRDSDGSHDTFYQVMGSEKGGRVRTYGLGPTPGELWGQNCVCQKRRISATEVENRLLDRMEEMERKYARIETQLSRLTSTMQKYLANRGASSKSLDSNQVTIRFTWISFSMYFCIHIYTCIVFVYLYLYLSFFIMHSGFLILLMLVGIQSSHMQMLLRQIVQFNLMRLQAEPERNDP